MVSRTDEPKRSPMTLSSLVFKVLPFQFLFLLPSNPLSWWLVPDPYVPSLCFSLLLCASQHPLRSAKQAYASLCIIINRQHCSTLAHFYPKWTFLGSSLQSYGIPENDVLDCTGAFPYLTSSSSYSIHVPLYKPWKHNESPCCKEKFSRCVIKITLLLHMHIYIPVN